jgi:hypothetical protein
MPSRLAVLATAVTLALPLGLASPAAAGRVGTHHEASTDFTRYKTYRWQTKEGPAVFDVDGPVRAAAEEILEKRGLRRVAEGEGADLELRYNAGTGDQLVAGVGVTADWWGNLVAIPAGQSYTTGGISFIFTDVAEGEVVWIGWKVEKGTTADAPMVMRKRAPKYARQILSEFPPD